MADPTPTAWRVASLALLGGGGAAGLLASRIPGGPRMTGLGLAVAAAYVVPLAVASRRPPIAPPPARMPMPMRPPSKAGPAAVEAQRIRWRFPTAISTLGVTHQVSVVLTVTGTY